MFPVPVLDWRIDYGRKLFRDFFKGKIACKAQNAADRADYFSHVCAAVWYLFHAYDGDISCAGCYGNCYSNYIFPAAIQRYCI